MTAPTKVIWRPQPEHGGNIYGPSPDLISPVVNGSAGRNKPRSGGLWTSPEDTEWGWEDWCQQENPGWLGSRWRLTVEGSARILRIDSPDDLVKAFERYPIVHRWHPKYVDHAVDWEAAGRDFDAVWLTAEGHWSTRLSRVADLSIGTYNWDCDTVLWYRWAFSKVERAELVPA